jgi:hypothetical protein
MTLQKSTMSTIQVSKASLFLKSKIEFQWMLSFVYNWNIFVKFLSITEFQEIAK